MYADIKSEIMTFFPFSNDATLIVLGLLIWLLTGLIFRLPMTRLACLAPLIIITVAIEIADVMFLAQTPMRAISDFAMVVLPVAIIVFFQHQGWVRA
jgi:fucose 4-O-acetylase-like acetyltransferase